MPSGRAWTYLLVAALAAVAVGGGLLLFRPGSSPAPQVRPEAAPPRLSGAPPYPAPPSDPVDAALLPVQALMDQWRLAILKRSPDEVLACDAAFLDDPSRYKDALVASAQTDSADQVRAFSTRVLGKFKDPSLVPVFRRMLTDPHRFVRENAAWALGEMGSREAARDLARVARTDPAENVRSAAAQAVQQLR
jgi:hypothetical protein